MTVSRDGITGPRACAWRASPRCSTRIPSHHLYSHALRPIPMPVRTTSGCKQAIWNAVKLMAWNSLGNDGRCTFDENLTADWMRSRGRGVWQARFTLIPCCSTEFFICRRSFVHLLGKRLCWVLGQGTLRSLVLTYYIYLLIFLFSQANRIPADIEHAHHWRGSAIVSMAKRYNGPTISAQTLALEDTPIHTRYMMLVGAISHKV